MTTNNLKLRKVNDNLRVTTINIYHIDGGSVARVVVNCRLLGRFPKVYHVFEKFWESYVLVFEVKTRLFENGKFLARQVEKRKLFECCEHETMQLLNDYCWLLRISMWIGRSLVLGPTDMKTIEICIKLDLNQASVRFPIDNVFSSM